MTSSTVISKEGAGVFRFLFRTQVHSLQLQLCQHWPSTVVCLIFSLIDFIDCSNNTPARARRNVSVHIKNTANLGLNLTVIQSRPRPRASLLCETVVDHKTVAKVRKEGCGNGEIPQIHSGLRQDEFF